MTPAEAYLRSRDLPAPGEMERLVVEAVEELEARFPLAPEKGAGLPRDQPLATLDEEPAMTVQPIRRPFSVEEYHRMGEARILTEDDRVELIEGEIVRMTPIGRRHSACVARLTHLFTRKVGDRAVVWVQNPVRLSDLSEPQPDLAILEQRDDFYAGREPAAADVLLAVEVSDTSVAVDRDVKAPLYARHGVPELWIVDLEAEEVHMHREPSADGYHSVETRGRGDRLAPERLPRLEIEVAEVLGG